MARTFIHREHHPTDPAFLHEERKFLDRQWSALHLMRLHRDELAADIERSKSRAREAHIRLEPDHEVQGPKLMLAGIGHPGAGDEGAGIEVARRVQQSAPSGVKVIEGDPGVVGLVQSWGTAEDTILIEAARSGAPPGTVSHLVMTRKELDPGRLPEWVGNEIAEALEFGRMVDLLPRRITVYGIEAESSAPGDALTAAVDHAVTRLATLLTRELAQPEQVRLPEGTELTIRPIRAADREAYLANFEHLSDETRYKRFLGPIRRLSENQVAYFTEVDHRDHEALVAVTPGGEIVGIARYIRLPDEPGVAEVAITVTDEWQHRGVGYALLERLVPRAREAGVTTFRAFCLSGNTDIQQLLREQSSDARVSRPEPGVVELETTLPAEEAETTPLRRLLRVAAHAYHGARS